MEADEEVGRPLWPDVPRIAFGYNGTRPVANLGWVLDGRQMYGYVEGYAWGARALYQEALRSHRSPEIVLFPLAFLWRHHLELAMKWIIALGRRSEGRDWGFPRGHNLLKLWHECKPLIEPMAGEPGDSIMENVSATLAEFQKLDERADGFRYPVDPSGEVKSLKAAPSAVSLPQLQEAMEALSTFFDCVRTQMEHEADMAGEEAEFYFRAAMAEEDLSF